MSGMVTRSRTRRASRTRPRISTEASTRLSMLPPEMGRAARLPGPTARGCDRPAPGLAGEALRGPEQRAERRGAGSFGPRLLDLEQRRRRALDGLFLDHQ